MALVQSVKYGFLKKPLEERRASGLKSRIQHLDRVPIIIGKLENSILPTFTFEKFSMPASFQVSKFCDFINDEMGRSRTAPLYVYVDRDTVLHRRKNLGCLYQEHRSDDYYLYLAYSETNIHSTSECISDT